MVVDDEEEIRLGIIKKIDWESNGFEVVGDAENGQEALEKAEKLQPDVIMTDIKMPFMDGLELGKRLAETMPSTKIIVFSGCDDFEYAHQAIKINVIEYVLKPINSIELVEVLKSFEGIISQRPPIYSALKVNGKKLYEYAREGKEVQIEERPVEIYEIKFLDMLSEDEAMIDVQCSKGTYIRTLCSDIGERLNCGAHMSFLLRTRSGVFDLDNSLTLEEIDDLSGKAMLHTKLIPPDTVLVKFGKVVLGTDEMKRYVNGAFVDSQLSGKISELPIRVYDLSGKFIGLGEIVEKNNKKMLKSKKLF
jgi:tRNA U55 pseudouridine synthase TruB